MTFAREKRLLLGAAALLAPLPLPLNDVLEWPALALFLAVVANFLRRAAQGSERWLSHRALNLLGLAYLPVLVVDVAASGRALFVRPILHLILFSLAAKLWSLAREKDKWQVWIGIFFLFLAAMSTSTHPAVLAYLVAFVALAVLLLARFVHLHVLSSHAPRGAAAPRLPLGALAVGVVVAALAFAVPLFALMPRVRTPMVGGPSGFGGQQALPQAGFSDEMSLDLIGRIRDNPAIALRLRFSGRTPDPAAMRFKAAAYDVWEGRSWRLTAAGRWVDRRRGTGDALRLGPGAAVGRVDVELEPLQSRHLVLPLEAIEVELGDRRVARDRAGALSLGSLPTSRVLYGALLGPAAVSQADPPGFDAADAGPLDARGIDERMRALAAEWTAGAAGDRQRAERLVARFHRDFGYTTVFLGRGGDDPIATFLYDTRRGHCEYFASSMVLLLRALDIPARLVTGFYGAEWSGWEDAWIVRQSYAHAWVEAWIEGEGWQVFDPTPPAGLPAAPERDLRLWAQQAWEAALLRWDRWVISYDFEDQVSVLGGLRAAWDDLWARLFAGDERGRERAPAAAVTAAAERGAAAAAAASRRGATGVALALGFAAAVASAWWLRRRPRWDATLAYLGLRRALAGAGLAVPDSLAPLAVARAGADRLPAAASAIEALVAAYLAEAFAGRALEAERTGALRGELRAVESAARRSGRPRRRPT